MKFALHIYIGFAWLFLIKSGLVVEGCFFTPILDIQLGHQINTPPCSPSLPSDSVGNPTPPSLPPPRPPMPAAAIQAATLAWG